MANFKDVFNFPSPEINFRPLVSSVGRALACWVGGRGFKPQSDHHSGSSEITEKKVLPL